ncbi:alpha/beta hydrolase [Cryobacterium sp. PAMC25264]|uniref:alpha/beta hydrolase n=1 Tax=Cryobacterium sp. PAMC25264 TaxID=2861288 RepID=UPI001C62545F|nr:hypothetical protein [Cryobacterium sp. PAMC25264]QYF73080.1 hypothetical protein KY500_15180 [Cryobacterium sp. PAMC25264]
MTAQLSGILSPGWAAKVTETSAVVLLLHGYGSNESDLAGLAPALGLALPWAALRAPLELGTGGAAWFTITTPGNPDAEPVAQATDAIWAWVDANLDSTTSVIPIGFSQGGLMASQLVRTRPQRVLAPVVLGGFVLGADQPGDATLSSTLPPVFWGRGTDDRVIGEAAIDRTSAFLPSHFTLVERRYAGLAHRINAAEIEDVRSFLALNAGAEAVTAR